MALNVQGLANFVDQQKMELIGKTVLAGKTAKLINFQSGVKGSAAINLLTTAPVFGDGTACGWNEAGTSTLTQRNIVTGQIKINQSFCDKALANRWAGYQVKIAAGSKTLPFEQEFIDSIIRGIEEVQEIAIWQGDTASTNPNLNKYDGLIKIIDAASGVKGAVNTDITSITVSNVLTVIDNVYVAIPTAILDKAVIMCGADTFRLAVMALRNANLYHYSQEADAAMEITLPGTSTKLHGVNGLNGTNRLFAFDPMAVYRGADLESDAEKFEFWYSQDNREFRLAIEFNCGVQIAFPDQVVQFTLQ